MLHPVACMCSGRRVLSSCLAPGVHVQSVHGPLILLGTRLACAVGAGSSRPAWHQACVCSGCRVLSSSSVPGMYLLYMQGALIMLGARHAYAVGARCSHHAWCQARMCTQCKVFRSCCNPWHVHMCCAGNSRHATASNIVSSEHAAVCSTFCSSFPPLLAPQQT
jgi:hypothetical protein